MFGPVFRASLHCLSIRGVGVSSSSPTNGAGAGAASGLPPSLPKGGSAPTSRPSRTSPSVLRIGSRTSTCRRPGPGSTGRAVPAPSHGTAARRTARGPRRTGLFRSRPPRRVQLEQPHEHLFVLHDYLFHVSSPVLQNIMVGRAVLETA